MNDRHDLQLLLKSGPPIVVVETADEQRFLQLLIQLATSASADAYRPLYRWTITDGLQRIDLDLEPQRHNSDPQEGLRHIRAVRKPGIYALLDFHPFLADPLNVRLLKDIAIEGQSRGLVLLLISHSIQLPAELESLSARFEMRLPGAAERHAIVQREIDSHAEEVGREVHVDPQALDLLIGTLGGLPHSDVERLARSAVRQDGAITADDVPAVMQAKYRLLNRGGVLGYEHDTASLADVAGFRGVKVWLQQRRLAFTHDPPPGLDPPKGILLIGVQGCGKSLAARAAAGALNVPLLRLDFGSLYDKYHGETERNLRDSLRTAETMSPCVLWLDEIEKGVATGHDESGTSRRVLGSLLTWMAESRSRVLLVATANDVAQLPPELVRKGRFDEIFFVDLPSPTQRADIFAIHLRRRGLDPETFDLPRLVTATDGFSGAEIEQAVVAALYAAHAVRQAPTARHLLAEVGRTRPLSVVMAERVASLRRWAKDRTVPAD
ncbi:MAG: AAA family ATPase [Gammaproteobacteria bacterium]|nr:AAA family ATPase [Gammaproteobacteria bacterium]